MGSNQRIFELLTRESPEKVTREALTVLSEAIPDKTLSEKTAIEVLSDFIEQKEKKKKWQEEMKQKEKEKVERYYIARENVRQGIQSWFKSNTTHASQIVLGELGGKGGYPTYWKETPSDGEYPNNWVTSQICIKFPLKEKVVYFNIPVEGNPFESNSHVREVPVVIYEIYKVENGEIIHHTQMKEEIGWYQNMKDWELQHQILREIYNVPLYQQTITKKFKEFLRIILGYYPD